MKVKWPWSTEPSARSEGRGADATRASKPARSTASQPEPSARSEGRGADATRASKPARSTTSQPEQSRDFSAQPARALSLEPALRSTNASAWSVGRASLKGWFARARGGGRSTRSASTSPSTHAAVAPHVPDDPNWRGVEVLIPEASLREHRKALELALVDRRGVTSASDPDASLMKSEAILCVLEPGQKLRFNASATRALSTASEAEPGSQWITPSNTRSDRPLPEDQRLRLCADWRRRGTIEVPGVNMNANVFGGVGALLPARDPVVVPTLRADAPEAREALMGYGATLVSSGSTIDLGNEVPLYGVTYRFDEDYTREFVFQAQGDHGKAGGGGLFVETHPFPHFFAPLEESCRGALILGKDRGGGEFDFTAFKIPYEKALYVAPNVIHGDSFFVGKYGIVLANAEADTVLFRRPGDARVAGEVCPVSLSSVSSH